MIRSLTLLITSALTLATSLHAQPRSPDSTCTLFYKQLESYPHHELDLKEGTFKSMAGGESFTGCMISYRSADTLLNDRHLPAFNPAADGTLHNSGWRLNPEYSADGPGSSLHGIENDQTLCLVYKNQPTYFENDELVHEPKITLEIQCMKNR